MANSTQSTRQRTAASSGPRHSPRGNSSRRTRAEGAPAGQIAGAGRAISNEDHATRNLVALVVLISAVLVGLTATAVRPQGLPAQAIARVVGPEMEAWAASEDHSCGGDELYEQTLAGEQVPGENGETWSFGAPTTINQTTSGQLLFATDVTGVYLPAPTIEQNVTVDVYGLIARTTVEQRFHNPTDHWAEGIYVFPLPDRSAVDELLMQVGERTIVGEIQEKEQARRTYEEARAAGQRASLVEQERPNLFTNSVANIGPGEEIVVTIEYQQDLRYDDGRISLRFPMVVAPRFIPGTQQVQGFDGSGWGTNTDQVPDAERITPPVVLTDRDLQNATVPGQTGQTVFADIERPQTDPYDRHGDRSDSGINPVTLTVFIDQNLVLDGIESPSHDVLVHDRGSQYIVELEHRVTPANRDFVLEWWPDRRSAPQAALYTQDFTAPLAEGETTSPEHTYAHLMVVPPQQGTNSLLNTPRELTFVIDTSGSMGGTSIEQARAALLLALDRLQPHDTFDVIEFNSVARSLYSRPEPANTNRVEEAKRWVRGLQANGGTNILAALELALGNGGVSDEESSSNRSGPVRQVVFVTDGSVGNEEQLFRHIHQQLGDRRLFTVGIGSAPNNFFMSRAAEHGRGTYTNISDLNEVQQRMQTLFAKLESPALTDLTVSWDGWTEEEIAQIEMWPQRLPDLYAGEPVVLNARLPLLERGGELVVRGWRDGTAWETRLPIQRGAERKGVDRLWARQKIRSISGEMTRGVRSQDEGRQQIVTLGLAHHLVTQFTSLVAVDKTPARPLGEELVQEPIPVRLPAGWNAGTTFGAQAVAAGTLPVGGTASTLLGLLGLLTLGAGLIVLRVSR